MKSHDEQPPNMLPAQMASFEREIQLLLEQQCLAKARQVADRYVAKSFRASSTIDIATTAWFRSRCLSAQTSLEEGNLGRANDELDELLEHEQSLKSALLCRLLLYSAESNARLNIRPVALRRLSQLKSHSATIQSRPLLQLRELRCWCLLGEVDDVLDAAQHIQQRLAGDDYHLALLCSEIARAFENANKLQVADDYWAKAMLYCSGPTADTIRATVNMHHGRRAHLQGRLQDALDNYEGALKACATGETPQATEVTLRRCLLYIDINQKARAQTEWDLLSRQHAVEPWPDELIHLADLIGGLLSEVPPPSPLSCEARAFSAAHAGDFELGRKLYQQLYHNSESPLTKARCALAGRPVVRYFLPEGGKIVHESRVGEAVKPGYPERRARARRHPRPDADAPVEETIHAQGTEVGPHAE